VARALVEAPLRRNGTQQATDDTLKVGDLELACSGGAARRAGREIELTSKELYALEFWCGRRSGVTRAMLARGRVGICSLTPADRSAH